MLRLSIAHLIVGVTVAAQLLAASPAGASSLINEDFSNPGLPGWSESVTANTTYHYTVSSGLKFSDNDPVTGEGTSIVPGENNLRGIVTFLQKLPTAVSDFEAVLSFSWDQTVGMPDSGDPSANASTVIAYLTLYGTNNGIIANAGLYDNWRTASGAFHASVTGNDAQTTAAGTLAITSNGINTITMRREGQLLTIDWKNGEGEPLFFYSGNNDLDIGSVGLRIGMMRVDGATGISRTKVGEVTIHHLSFQAIPEAGSVALWSAGAAMLLLPAARKRRAKLP